MPTTPGQEPGHADEPARGADGPALVADEPVGFTWGAYVADLVSRHGSLAAVAARLAEARGFTDDAATIERGLRRLRGRGHRDGGVWGRRALRQFGLPGGIAARARWMGHYHTRFTDLPRSLCRDLLALWDRPPVSESAARAWIQLGLASVALRGPKPGNRRAAVRHIDQARLAIPRAEPAAHVELALVEGFVASRLAPAEVAGHLRDAGAILADAARATRIPTDDRACLFARWIDQRAYELNVARDGRPRDPAAALALYESIPTEGAPPFALCRRANGIAWSLVRLGDRDGAISYARTSVRHAGDGGSLRMRVMALNLLARVLPGADGEDARSRARAIAQRLEDDALLDRVDRDGSIAGA